MKKMIMTLKIDYDAESRIKNCRPNTYENWTFGQVIITCVIFVYTVLP